MDEVQFASMYSKSEGNIISTHVPGPKVISLNTSKREKGKEREDVIVNFENTKPSRELVHIQVHSSPLLSPHFSVVCIYFVSGYT